MDVNLLSSRPGKWQVKPGKHNLFSFAADVFTFLIAGAAPFVVKAGGDLSVGQVLIMPLLPVLLLTCSYRLRKSRLRMVFLLLLLWLIGEIVTDVYRQSEFIDWIRVDARIVFTAADVLALAMLIGGKTQRHLIFYSGLGTGYILQVRLQPNEYTDFWKFGYSTGVTLFVVLMCCYFYRRRQYPMIVLLLVGISAVDAAFNFRSPILLLFVTTVLIVPVIPERVGRVRILPASQRGRLLVKVSLSLVAAKAASSLVLFLGAQGYLGEEARVKDTMQAQAKGGMLLGGRPEILVSSRAVIDSPILGHGSWAKDIKYAEMYADLRVKYNISDTEQGNREEERSDLIPTHSHIMDAWVDAGILGATFWIYVLYLVGKAIAQASLKGTSLAPVYCYTLIGFMWSILFSPSGSVTTLPDSFLIIVACDVTGALAVRKSHYLGYGE
jgi:O-antigen ligase